MKDTIKSMLEFAGWIIFGTTLFLFILAPIMMIGYKFLSWFQLILLGY
jgi:hypothetical protein